MACIIRAATPMDAPELIYLIQAHAKFERSEASCTLETLRIALGQTPAPIKVLLAFVNGVAVGYASLTVDFSTWKCKRWAHLDCLFVSASHRGQNIGGKLFGAVCDEAENLELSDMEWQTPLWNTDAIRFYERSGAQQSGKARFILRDLSDQRYKSSRV